MAENSQRRTTRQKKLVLAAVYRENHPSARDIFDTIAQTERISLGTVYRNLAILEQEGEILEVTSDPTLVRYDRRLDPHHHLHCRACGRVYDMPLPYDAGFDRERIPERVVHAKGAGAHGVFEVSRAVPEHARFRQPYLYVVQREKRICVGQIPLGMRSAD